MSGPTSIDHQIAELKREISLRKNVLPKQVAAGKMRQAEMDHHMAAITAALHTVMAVKRLRATMALHRFFAVGLDCSCGAWRMDPVGTTDEAHAQWLDHVFERSKAAEETA